MRSVLQDAHFMMQHGCGTFLVVYNPFQVVHITIQVSRITFQTAHIILQVTNKLFSQGPAGVHRQYQSNVEVHGRVSAVGDASGSESVSGSLEMQVSMQA